MMVRSRMLLVLGAMAVSQFGFGPGAAAQSMPRIWSVAFGTTVANLPEEFVLQACGTNGGPPTIQLESFTEFKRCPVEQATGLREVWFSYDDTEEYFLRALRIDAERIDSSRANVLFEQLVINSLLIDDQGRVRGYRIISDPREEMRNRINADAIAGPVKNVVFGAFGWECKDLPRLEGEGDFRGQFTKEICRKDSNGRRISIETHVLLKPGQRQMRVGEGLQLNEFDVQARIEVIDANWQR